MAVEIFMAKMSDHMEAGEIVGWLAHEGDQVEEGQPILEVMTDKAVVEVVAEASGVLKGIRSGAVEGAMVPVGETIAFIAASDEEVPLLPPLRPAEVSPAEEEPSALESPGLGAVSVPPGKVRATPVARRLAKSLGVDLVRVTGTGPGGRIKEEDVRAFAEAQQAVTAKAVRGVSTKPAARPARELDVDIARVPGSVPAGRVIEEDVRASTTLAAQPAEEAAEWLSLSTIQQLTGQRMLESILQAPQFALTTKASMTQALWLREALMERIEVETNKRLSITAILVKIVAEALKNHPRVNASFEDGRVRLHPQRNINVAVGTEDGLVVPVIKEADRKSLAQVVGELGTFKARAREMRFSAEDLTGGTFTISNLGMYGIDHFNAIINPPQSAILAVGRIIKTPVGLPDDTIALRPMMSLTLTVDHRSMDGVQGARFLAEVKDQLEKPFFLL